MDLSLIQDDDDDSALDPSEQTQRPIDNAFNQQRIPAWHPILDPLWVIIGLFYLGVILIPVGIKMQDIQDNVVEIRKEYDDWRNYVFAEDGTTILEDNNPHLNCSIGNEFNANRTCDLTFTIPKYMEPPILLHYELRNFHQNHRNYFKSRDPYQLLGQVGSQDTISENDCQPLNKLGDITLNPCGLIANTLFNDYFTVIDGKDANGNDLELIEQGITWRSDVKYVYAQPNGFNYSECTVCDASCCLDGDSCTEPYRDPKDGKCYRYFYPDDNTTQYLYETYPDIINPIEGVTNEHFMVWMRVATQPTFRKLYGWFDQPLAENSTITIRVNANYVVTRFRGGKALLLGNTSIFGGKNPYMGSTFFGFGVFCIVAGALFSLKHFLKPRKLGDPKYLHYKEE